MAKAKITQLDIETYSVVEQQKRMTEYGEKLIDVERIVKKPIDIWLIGNTGMRNPWRIPSGFKVYAESNMVLFSTLNDASFFTLNGAIPA